MTQAAAALIASIRECDAKMGALKDAAIESGRGTQVILVATDLLAEQSRNALAAIPIIEAAERALVGARNSALEDAAKWHDAEAAKYERRLARQAGRRDIPAFEMGIGGQSIGFSGTEVSRYREALQDEISMHVLSAKAIRALGPGAPMSVSDDELLTRLKAHWQLIHEAMKGQHLLPAAYNRFEEIMADFGRLVAKLERGMELAEKIAEEEAAEERHAHSQFGVGA